MCLMRHDIYEGQNIKSETLGISVRFSSNNILLMPCDFIGVAFKLSKVMMDLMFCIVFSGTISSPKGRLINSGKDMETLGPLLTEF